MKDCSYRGGARIGWVSASWPFAKLTANSQRLNLACLGRYEFAPIDVISLKRYGLIPFIASGIAISHNRVDLPETVVFWCMGSRDDVLEAIKQSGFEPRGTYSPRPSGVPFKWSAAIFVVVVWNVLFLLDGAMHPQQVHKPGGLAALALLMVFCLATSAKFLPAVQRFVLKDGRHVGEIRAFLTLLQVVSGLLSLVFLLSLL